MRQNYSSLVFDLDGTLVDSKIDFAGLRRELKVSKQTDLLAEIARWAPERQSWAMDLIHRYEQEGAMGSSVFEHVPELLTRLRAEQIPIAIFTRNSRSTAELTLQLHGLQADLVIAREDAEPKPNPAGLFAIAQKLNLSTKKLLFIGDYAYDLMAGKSAGVDTALFLPKPADFETQGAAFIFNHYRDLERLYFV